MPALHAPYMWGAWHHHSLSVPQPPCLQQRAAGLARPPPRLHTPCCWRLTNAQHTFTVHHPYPAQQRAAGLARPPPHRQGCGLRLDRAQSKRRLLCQALHVECFVTVLFHCQPLFLCRCPHPAALATFVAVSRAGTQCCCLHIHTTLYRVHTMPCPFPQGCRWCAGAG